MSTPRKAPASKTAPASAPEDAATAKPKAARTGKAGKAGKSARSKAAAARKPATARSPVAPPDAAAAAAAANDPGPAKKATSAPAGGGKADTAPLKAEFTFPDPAEFSRNLARIDAQSQQLVTDFLAHQAAAGAPGPMDPLNIGRAFVTALHHLATHPEKLVESQISLWTSYVDLWQNMARRLMGEDVEPLIEPRKGDKRWAHQDWHENEIFDFIKQSYLLTARWMQGQVEELEGLDPATRRKVDFYTRQFADAISPTNFVLTNPEVLRETLSTSGENLVKGLENLLEDLERGKGQLAISQTDMDYFKVGENVATAPGKVVFRNKLGELLQFDPTTDKVYERPLIIFPPWINKYYILDLRPENSFIRWAVSRGYTVFVVSWVNPDEELAKETFETYMRTGILEMLDAVEKATGTRDVLTIGYCIGGTLLGATLGYLAAEGDDRVTSATFFAAQHDFTEAGELQVFIDDEQLAYLEDRMEKAGGVLDSHAMAMTFNMLRANDLIWSYVVNNYLLGRDPKRFDLLFWNADMTRMPKELHLYYLRECYQKNTLARGEMVLGGRKIDLKKVRTPIFMQSSREDHIAPYGSVYRSARLFGGPVRFMMAGSGHIAGVINHPDAKKYQHWTNETLPDTVEAWIADAKEHPGSWWNYWDEWQQKLAGPKVPARKPGDGKLKPLCDAPGTYVQVRSSE
ncbi:MAG: class I poly(R)-hydroxyalkanoic acid synthase [Alphaproteobacteria bacterium]|nr:class I poly(R)-hydroxyalkanoic acid synthase [Alphaproteobacteria bacterium]